MKADLENDGRKSNNAITLSIRINKIHKELHKVVVQILAADVVPDQVANNVQKRFSHTLTTKDNSSQTDREIILKKFSTFIKGTTEPKKRNLASLAAKAKGTE